MKHLTTLLAVCGALALSAAGCVGDLEPIGGPVDPNTPPPGVDAGGSTEPDPEPTGEAQALFVTNVHSAIQATCGIGTACHTTTPPTFAVADPATSYTQVTGNVGILAPGFDPAGAKLLEYGQNGQHKLTTYEPGDITAIENWLLAEQAEAAGSTEVSAMAKWSGCMDLQEWIDSDVADQWADKNAQGQGDCDACHNLGADLFMASNQDERVFNNITTNPALMQSYFTLDETGQSVVINRARLEKVGSQLPPHQGHGAFDLDDGPYQALEAYYQITMDRFTQNNCGPPRFPQ